MPLWDDMNSQWIRAANILAGKVKVGADVMADLGLMLQYDYCNWSIGLGYNFWIRTAEKYKDPVVNIPSDIFSYSSSISRLLDINPVLITTDNIDYCAAMHTRALSNKVFGFISYTWKDCEWKPFLALGGEGEFADKNTAANQWGVVLKGGIAF